MGSEESERGGGISGVRVHCGEDLSWRKFGLSCAVGRISSLHGGNFGFSCLRTSLEKISSFRGKNFGFSCARISWRRISNCRGGNYGLSCVSSCVREDPPPPGPRGAARNQAPCKKSRMLIQNSAHAHQLRWRTLEPFVNQTLPAGKQHKRIVITMILVIAIVITGT